MNKNKQKRQEEDQRKQSELSKRPKVKMKFSEEKFYNDLSTPLYEAGKVYEVEAHMVERWLKRGGVIVGQEPTLPKVEDPKGDDADQKAPEVVDDKDLVEDDEEKKEDDKKSDGKN